MNVYTLINTIWSNSFTYDNNYVQTKDKFHHYWSNLTHTDKWRFLLMRCDKQLQKDRTTRTFPLSRTKVGGQDVEKKFRDYPLDNKELFGRTERLMGRLVSSLRN